MMRTRDAWLAAIAATLGLTEEACRAKETAPAAAREAPSASASASAPIVAEIAPSASAEVAPSATASAMASASSSAAPRASASTLAQLLGDPKALDPKILEQLQASCGAPAISTGTIGIGTIGTGRIGPQNLSCGATPGTNHPTTPSLRAEISTSVNNGAAGDDRVVAMLRARLRNCANHALQQDPSQQGRLLVITHIAANGEVTNATVASNSGLSESCATCMARAVRTAQFPTGAQRVISITVNQTKQQSP
jgi:hypothetical protein